MSTKDLKTNIQSIPSDLQTRGYQPQKVTSQNSSNTQPLKNLNFRARLIMNDKTQRVPVGDGYSPAVIKPHNPMPGAGYQPEKSKGTNPSNPQAPTSPPKNPKESKCLILKILKT